MTSGGAASFESRYARIYNRLLILCWATDRGGYRRGWSGKRQRLTGSHAPHQFRRIRLHLARFKAQSPLLFAGSGSVG